MKSYWSRKYISTGFLLVYGLFAKPIDNERGGKKNRKHLLKNI